jgi:hypothetical protein
VRAIDVPTVFRDFEDYWSPFLGGQAPAPSYAMSLSEERRAALRERIRASLPTNSRGSTTSSPALGPYEAFAKEVRLLRRLYIFGGSTSKNAVKRKSNFREGLFYGLR